MGAARSGGHERSTVPQRSARAPTRKRQQPTPDDRNGPKAATPSQRHTASFIESASVEARLALLLKRHQRFLAVIAQAATDHVARLQVEHLLDGLMSGRMDVLLDVAVG